ncbi:hypothetical protein ACFLUV_01805 [Elusimicrobiota bacterium]
MLFSSPVFLCIRSLGKKIIFIIISAIFLTTNLFAATEVSGIIPVDTNWTLESSPYIVADNVTVESGATLTIEPGVEVLYSGPYKISILGSIIANGTAEEKIIFKNADSGKLAGAVMIKFEGADLSGSQLNHITMSNAEYAIYDNYSMGALSMDNMSITNTEVVNYSGELVFINSEFNDMCIRGDCWGNGKIEIKNSYINKSELIAGNLHRGLIVGKSTATNCFFDVRNIGIIRDSYLKDCRIKTDSNVRVDGQTLVINKCRLMDSPIELTSANVLISDSIFKYSSDSGIVCRRGKIKNSSIIGNGSGIAVSANGRSLLIDKSDIRQNSIGVYLTAGAAAMIENSNIYNNSKYNVYCRSVERIHAPNNYWGTADQEKIKEKIYDYYDNGSFGKVDYSYYRGCPNEYNNIGTASIPKVSIEMESDTIEPGEKIKITIIGMDDEALSKIWWQAENTSIAELDEKHVYDCSGESFAQSWTIDTTDITPGLYRIRVGAVDSSGIEVSKECNLNVINPIVFVDPVLLNNTDYDFRESEEIAYYRVYWDRGEGKIDYEKPVAVIQEEKVTWEEEQLVLEVSDPIFEENKTYQFVVKAVCRSGREVVVRKPVSITRIRSKEKAVVARYSSGLRILIPSWAFIVIGGEPGYPDSGVNTHAVTEKVYEEDVILEIVEESIDTEEIPKTLEPINEYIQIKILKPGCTPLIQEEISIIIPYSDSNQDGLVDGTFIPEDELIILWHNPASKEWEKKAITYVDTDKNTCTIKTKEQGKFAIFSLKGFVSKPVKNLSGVANGNMAEIKWSFPLTAKWDAHNIYIKDGMRYEKNYEIQYNMYTDKGTGKINYSKPVARLSSTRSSWISPELERGMYRFAVRVEDNEGNEEKNRGYVEVEIKEQMGTAKASIKVPKDGKRVRGNAVTIMAEATEDTKRVALQYKKKWKQAAPKVVDKVTMACDGRIKVTLLKASAELISDIFLASPDEELIIKDNLTNVGAVVEQEYTAGTELNFFIRTYASSWGYGTYDHYAWGENSSYFSRPYCKIKRINMTSWELSFEDLPGGKADWDYNDVVVSVEIMPSGDYDEYPDTEWINISLDSKKPYSCYWNTSRLDNGGYYLRAIAYDKNGNPDPEPGEISVIVDDVNWDIHEDGNPDVDPNNEHRKSEKISKDKETEVVIADGTSAKIPKGVIKEKNTVLDITVLDHKKMEKYNPPEEASIKPVKIFRKFEFKDGTHTFDKDITLSMPYEDDDNDDIVDGTDIRVEDLRVVYLDEEREEWIDVSEHPGGKDREKEKNGKGKENSKKSSSKQTVNHSDKTIVAKVNHFTIFALMAYTPAKNLDNVIAYPNPFKPNSGFGHDKITFDGITEEVKIRIFTVAGRLAREWEGDTAPDYRWEWDAKNDSGDDLASGLYIYVVTADGKEKARGKIVIIR